MDYYRTIAERFQSTIETIALSVDSLATPLERACQLMTQALLEEHKLIVCGNGVDGAVAQLLTSHLLNRFKQDRPALPALSLGADATSLSAIAGTYGLDEIFARQVQALGQPGDILLCIHSGEGATNLQRAVQAARERNMAVIALSNSEDRVFSELIGDRDVEVCVSAHRRASVIELQVMAINCLCELLDLSLFGPYNQD